MFWLLAPACVYFVLHSFVCHLCCTSYRCCCDQQAFSLLFMRSGDLGGGVLCKKNHPPFILYSVQCTVLYNISTNLLVPFSTTSELFYENNKFFANLQFFRTTKTFWRSLDPGIFQLWEKGVTPRPVRIDSIPQNPGVVLCHAIFFSKQKQ